MEFVLELNEGSQGTPWEAAITLAANDQVVPPVGTIPQPFRIRRTAPGRVARWTRTEAIRVLSVVSGQGATELALRGWKVLARPAGIDLGGGFRLRFAGILIEFGGMPRFQHTVFSPRTPGPDVNPDNDNVRVLHLVALPSRPIRGYDSKSTRAEPWRSIALVDQPDLSKPRRLCSPGTTGNPR